jgi:hypothetical protein
MIQRDNGIQYVEVTKMNDSIKKFVATVMGSEAEKIADGLLLISCLGELSG